MFPLLSPLPVLIPKWRDCKNDTPLAVLTPSSSLPLPHTSEKPKPASCSWVQRRWEEKAGSRKIYPQWSLKHEEAIDCRGREAHFVLELLFNVNLKHMLLSPANNCARWCFSSWVEEFDWSSSVTNRIYYGSQSWQYNNDLQTAGPWKMVISFHSILYPTLSSFCSSNTVRGCKDGVYFFYMILFVSIHPRVLWGWLDLDNLVHAFYYFKPFYWNGHVSSLLTRYNKFSVYLSL